MRSQGRVDRENGEPRRMTGAIIDLTREREFAAELRDAAERMALAEETAGFGVWEVDIAVADRDHFGRAPPLNGLPETGLRSTRSRRSMPPPTIAITSTR